MIALTVSFPDDTEEGDHDKDLSEGNADEVDDLGDLFSDYDNDDPDDDEDVDYDLHDDVDEL